MIHRIDENLPMSELPAWLQELWKLDYSLARRAEKHYLELIKQGQSLPIDSVSQQRELLLAFLEMNNWLSLENEENSKGVVDCYLKAVNCC